MPPAASGVPPQGCKLSRTLPNKKAFVRCAQHSYRQKIMTPRACAQVVLLGSKMGSIGDGRTGGGLVRSRCGFGLLGSRV